MTGFNRIVKQAFNMRLLKIGAHNDETVVVTPRCYISLAETNQPNKFKAIVTEHLGHIPVEDITESRGFVEIGKKDYYRDLEAKETQKIISEIYTNRRLETYKRTPVIIKERGESCRILQSVRSNSLVGVSQEFLDLVDHSQLNYEYEGEPTDPQLDEALGLIYIYNGTTTLVMHTSLFTQDQTKELLQLIQLVDFNKREGY